MLRNIGAVVAGFATMAVLVMIATAIAVKAMLPTAPTGQMPLPTSTYLAVNVLYSVAFAALGGWVTARLASTKALHYTAALAAVVLLMGILTAVATRAMPQYASQPSWYSWTLPVISGVAVLLGGWLRTTRARSVDTGP